MRQAMKQARGIACLAREWPRVLPPAVHSSLESGQLALGPRLPVDRRFESAAATHRRRSGGGEVNRLRRELDDVRRWLTGFT